MIDLCRARSAGVQLDDADEGAWSGCWMTSAAKADQAGVNIERRMLAALMILIYKMIYWAPKVIFAVYDFKRNGKDRRPSQVR